MASEYDYIIIGAGSAGCVLANRLSESGDSSVLLLEAGSRDTSLNIRIPAAFSKLFKSKVDWAFYTESQAHLNRRRLYWPRGKVLGGSSSINAMIYMRGNPADYDAWAASGNSAWAFRDLLPYFKKSERFAGGSSVFHGDAGPLHVEERRYTNPLSDAFIEAAVESGQPRNGDFNGPSQEGFGRFHVTQRSGRRWSAADAFLKPALSRANVTVKTGAHVHKVLMERGRASGVRYRQGNELKETRVGRAVLVCAGAVQSPQLLLLSGIGSAEQLRKHAIEVQLDLPGVGQNLLDHLAVPVVFRSRKKVSLASAESPLNLLRYFLLKRGMLVSNIAEAGGFVRSQASLDLPDLQYHFGPAYFVAHGFKTEPGHYFTVGPTLLTPESRGFIGLRAADPEAAPLIEPRYLSEARDLETLVRGIELGRDIVSKPAMADYLGAEVLPDPGAETSLEAHVRANVETLYHPMGTCKMGGDDMAVVDASLKVRGTENLYVADLSVAPTTIRGNTNAAAMRIGEKAADGIKRVR